MEGSLEKDKHQFVFIGLSISGDSDVYLWILDVY
jgi:hypothetical protein